MPPEHGVPDAGYFLDSATEFDDGCGHWLYADDPDGFARAVRSFLDRTPAHRTDSPAT
ncbi:hypothetical protein [Streptomyces sp. BP-8]|uniref:Alpha/beta hydrolase n=1 Tax=Streptomyces sirii TaxID=3127701 RepID=A0ABZ2QUX1_9ACTN